MGTLTNRSRRAVVVAIAALTVLPLLPTSADEPRSTVADLRYGVALYDYYQGNYFDALSELLVAKQRGGIRGHSDNPELIEGGISLSFGMERNAGDIFARLLSTDSEGAHRQPLDVRNAAWFYLGKLRYLREDWVGTQQSFNEIAGRFDPELAAEQAVLNINLAIRRGDLAEAESIFQNSRGLDDWRHYLYFNLGNGYARQGDYDTAQDYYRRLARLSVSKLPSKREEQLALYDKGLTAAGYSSIMQNDPKQAIQHFRQVRLDSQFSHRALLGYGWAAAEQQEYRRALGPWQELNRRSLLHPAVQEAMIATPYAYEKLGGRGQALLAYQNAENAFQKEIDRIDNVVAEMEQVDILSALEIADTDNRNWFLLNRNTGVEPQLTYLIELFSLNQFQGAVQELRDLLAMQKGLTQWRKRLDAYSYMLDQREIHRAEQLDSIAARQLEDELAGFMAQREQLSQQLQRITEQRDYLALVDDEEQRELVAMAASARAAIEQLSAAGEPVAEYRESLRRYYGLLYWEASQAFPEKQWAVQNQINQLDSAIAEAQGNLDRLNRVIREAPDIVPYRQRIAQLSDRLDQRSRQLNEAVLLAEETLREKITGELGKQRGRLQHYLSQARLAVARIYDMTAHPEIKPEAAP